MKNNEDGLQHNFNPNPAPPTPPAPKISKKLPEVPHLKKKDNERKGGAAVLVHSRSTEAISIGARKIAGASSNLVQSAGFLRSNKIAASLANLLGRNSLIGGLLASQMGGPLMLAGLLAWMGGMGIVILRLSALKFNQAQPQTNISPSLKMGASGLLIDSPMNRSLGYVAGANEGEMIWDKKHPNAPKTEKTIKQTKTQHKSHPYCLPWWLYEFTSPPTV